MPGGKGQTLGWAGFPVQEPLRPFCNQSIRPCRLAPFAVGRKLFVADQAVWPEVGYLHHKFVFTGMCRPADFRFERWFPKEAAVPAVNADFRDDLHTAQL